jgi:pimeloyl-ACP methyl ester carboxylesterase
MRLLGLLLLAFPAAVAQTQPGLEGHWQGTLDAGPMKLRLALHIQKDPGGGLTGTMDSLDQGAMGLPIDKITVEGSSVRLDLNRIGGSYEGKLDAAGGELTGEWKQGGASLPLSFKRSEKALELKRPQEPSKPYPYREEEVSFENKQAGVRLAGTLTLPRAAGPHAAVLLISGSGPQDRNETVAGHRPFLVLADYLTRKGIAVLRTDDRGVGGSTGDPRTATTEDLVGDTLAGVAFLKSRKDIDARRIGLIGHSEGGLIAPLAATRSADVAFLVLMAGPAVTGEQIMYRQSELIARVMGASDEAIARSREQQQRLFAIIRQEKDPATAEKKLRESLDLTLSEVKPGERASAEAAVKAQLQTLLTPWFRFFLTYDPAPGLAKLHQPVLAIAGSLDLQVPPDQNLPVIEKMLKAAGNKDFEIVRLPGLNHLFQTARTGSPMEYARIEETIAPAALETIANWILRHTRTPR